MYGGGKSSQGMDLREVQELIDTTPEKLTGLVVMTASKPVPGDEKEDVEVVPEIKLTLNNLAEIFQLFQTAFNHFCDLDFYDMGTGTKANGSRRFDTI